MNHATLLRAGNLFAARRAAAKVLERRRRLPRPPRLLPPDAAERAYVREVRRLAAEMHAAVVRYLVPHLANLVHQAAALRPAAPERGDAADDDAVRKLLDLVRARMMAVAEPAKVEQVVRQVAASVAGQNGGQLDKAFQAVLGVDLFRTEPWLAHELQLFVQSNVDAIDAFARRYFDEVSATVYDGVRQGVTADQIADDLSDRFGVAESRAKFLARNQVAQFNGQLAQLRQTQTGVERYTWRTSRDERVRRTHQQMEGKVCTWADRPLVGGSPAHPGEQVNCRCWAEPVMEDLIP